MKAQIMGLIRHVLTLGAGALAARGYFEASETEAIVAAVMTLVGVVWSMQQKKGKAA